MRQQKTKPLAEALRAWLEKTLTQVAAGSSIAQAIRHALGRWDGLVRFLDDGRIEIGFNTVERQTKTARQAVQIVHGSSLTFKRCFVCSHPGTCETPAN